MSSISLSLKMMLAATACAGLLVACGDDSGSGDKTETTKDAGKGKDAGKDAGRTDAGITIPHTNPGDDCTGLGGMCDDDQCDAPPCYSQCVNGTSDECKSMSDIIGSVLGDGGLNGILRDGGLGGILGDAGLGGVLGDSGLGGILGDAGAIGGMCTSGQMCTDSTSQGLTGTIIGLVAPAGQGICTTNDVPKECTTNQDCPGGTCFDGNTIGAQIPLVGAQAFTFIGWPIKFCLSPCKP